MGLQFLLVSSLFKSDEIQFLGSHAQEAFLAEPIFLEVTFPHVGGIQTEFGRFSTEAWSARISTSHGYVI
jgi:hypothetical protein